MGNIKRIFERLKINLVVNLIQNSFALWWLAYIVVWWCSG